MSEPYQMPWRQRAERAEAERDEARAQLAALREALTFLHAEAWSVEKGGVPYGRSQIYDACVVAARILASPADAAREHDARVRREALEEAARIADARATSEQVMHDRHARETEPTEYTRRRIDETRCAWTAAMQVADAIRALAAKVTL